MKTTNEILKSIDNRLRDLRGEIETLSAARAALHPGRTRPAAQRRTQVVARTQGRQAIGPATADTADEPVEVVARKTAAATAKRGARATDRAARRNGRAKPPRSAKVVTAESLDLLLVGTGGLATSEIAKRANGGHDQVLRLLRELEASGRVRRTGNRRGTRWYVITDEDRIEQRAAELAARSKRGA